MTEQELNMWKEDLEMITMLREKNEKLEHIIDELEKWLEEDDEEVFITFETGRCFNYKDVINKIYELKGSDSK